MRPGFRVLPIERRRELFWVLRLMDPRNAVHEMEGLGKPDWMPESVYRFVMFKALVGHGEGEERFVWVATASLMKHKILRCLCGFCVWFPLPTPQK